MRAGDEAHRARRACPAPIPTPSRPTPASRRRTATLSRLSFVGIRGLVRLGVGVALAVAVVVEDERAPALRCLLVVRLVPDLHVEPALDAGGSERRPQHVVVVEVHVAPGEARIDGRELLGLRVVHDQAALSLIDREAASPTDDPIPPGTTPASAACGRAPRPTRAPACPSRSCGRSSGCSRSLRRPSTATALPAAARAELGVSASRGASLIIARRVRLRIDRPGSSRRSLRARRRSDRWR